MIRRNWCFYLFLCHTENLLSIAIPIETFITFLCSSHDTMQLYIHPFCDVFTSLKKMHCSNWCFSLLVLGLGALRSLRGSENTSFLNEIFLLLKKAWWRLTHLPPMMTLRSHNSCVLPVTCWSHMIACGWGLLYMQHNTNCTKYLNHYYFVYYFCNSVLQI